MVAGVAPRGGRAYLASGGADGCDGTKPYVKLASTLVLVGMGIFTLERFGLSQFSSPSHPLHVSGALLSVLVIAPVVLLCWPGRWSSSWGGCAAVSSFDAQPLDVDALLLERGHHLAAEELVHAVKDERRDQERDAETARALFGRHGIAPISPTSTPPNSRYMPVALHLEVVRASTSAGRAAHCRSWRRELGAGLLAADRFHIGVDAPVDQRAAIGGPPSAGGVTDHAADQNEGKGDLDDDGHRGWPFTRGLNVVRINVPMAGRGFKTREQQWTGR